MHVCKNLNCIYTSLGTCAGVEPAVGCDMAAAGLLGCFTGS